MSHNHLNVHYRHPLRLRGYDYSQPGAYFVTVCTQERVPLFGEIMDGRMKLNDCGLMIVRWWEAVPSRFSVCATDAYIVMPNHFHSILVIVGATQRGRPDKGVGSQQQAPPPSAWGHPRRGAPTLGDMIGWFKAMSTNEYVRGVKQLNWFPFNKRL